MSLSLLLATRSLAFRKVQTALAVLGVALGVLALTLILGIQNGFRDAFVRQILETSGHASLSAGGARIRDVPGLLAALEPVPGLAGAAPAILGQAILENESAFMGVNFKAIDPDLEPRVTKLLDFVVDGEASFSSSTEVMLGVRVAEQLRVRPGDPVKLVLPGGDLYDLWVRGVFDTGMSAVDSQLVLVDLRFAARALKFRDGVSHIFLACDDPERADHVVSAAYEVAVARTGLRQSMGGESWKSTHATLLKAMDLERRAMLVIIALTLMVAGFGVSNVLTLMVYERHRDVGILRSMGASPSVMLWMFLLQGLLIGGGGAVLGCVASLGLGEALQRYPIPLPGDIYYADTLPIRFEVSEFLLIVGVSLLVAALAGLPSARRALMVDPAEVVHAS